LLVVKTEWHVSNSRIVSSEASNLPWSPVLIEKDFCKFRHGGSMEEKIEGEVYGKEYVDQRSLDNSPTML